MHPQSFINNMIPVQIRNGVRPFCSARGRVLLVPACNVHPTSRYHSTVCHSTRQPHVTIVGGGAAGLTAAFFAAELGVQVTVLERTREAGKKILMSGGTRCNVLPLEVDVQRDFFSDSPASAVRAVFASWNLDACRAWLEDEYSGVGLQLLEEEETAKLFPASNSSREVRDRLVQACLDRGVQFKYNASLELLQPLPGDTAGSTPATQPPQSQPLSTSQHTTLQQGEVATSSHDDAACTGVENGPEALPVPSGKGKRRRGKGKSDVLSTTPRQPCNGWVCRLQDGSVHHTDRLVLCTGGLSFPAVGTDGTGHRILKELGMPLIEPYPALTPLTGAHPGGAQLAGLSLYSVDLAAWLPGAKKPKKAARTGMLFTHKGYSGPAVLDVSHHLIKPMLQGGDRPTLTVNWTADPAEVWEEKLKAGGTAYVSTTLQRSGLRERLADAICAELGLETRRMCELRRDERSMLIQRLTAYELSASGHEGYKKAEVTGGGVPLTEICTRTMESKALPGLHLAGEILDVFGRIGGFNFYWAWVSGRLAGRGAALAAKEDAAARASTSKQQQPVAV